MWFATEQGLNRFDGVIVTPLLANDSWLSADNLSDVLVDRFDPYIWVATKSMGMDRYNIESGEHTSFNIIKDDPTSISGNSIVSIQQDSNGDIWVATYLGGICRLARGENTFQRFDATTTTNFPKARVGSMAVGDDGYVYLAHTNGGVSILNTNTRTIKRYVASKRWQNAIPSNNVLCIYCDHLNRVWVGTDVGLSLFNAQRNNFVRYPLKDPQGNDIAIYDIKQRKSGELIVATEFNGIYSLIVGDNKIPARSNFSRVKGGEKFDHTTIRTIYEDRHQNLWLGCYGDGVGFVSNTPPLFENLTLDAPLTYEKTRGLSIDQSGNLWVGTDGGGINVVQDKRLIKHYKNELGSPAVLCSLCDSSGKMWISTFGQGVTIYDPSTKRFTRPTLKSKMKNVRCLYELNDQIWLGGSSGIEVLDRRTHSTIATYSTRDGLPQKDIRSIVADRKGRIWIGSYGRGVGIFNSEMNRLNALNEKNGMLATNKINQLYSDHNGSMWIATNEGLVKIDTIKDIKNIKPQTIHSTESLPIMALTEDNRGNIWFSSDRSINIYDVKKQTTKSYNFLDGVAAGTFMSGSVVNMLDGTICFGSTKGVTTFSPKNLLQKSDDPTIRLNELRLLYSQTPDVESLNNIKIPQSNVVNLKHNQNNLQLIFSPTNYALSNYTEYSYRISKLDENWHSTDNEQRVTLRLLPPGKYHVEIRARIRNQEWCDNIATITINIAPPFWLTWWAISLYVIALSLIILAIMRYYYAQSRHQLELDYERKKRAELQKINDEKLCFYTNITHELRTPLTLILAPLESLQEETTLSEKISRKIDIAYQSASQLLTLINQLLEFRKCETQNKRLSVGYGDISTQLSEIGSLFRDSNTNTSVNIAVNIEPEINLMYDSEVITIILNNLLSNAIKHTSEGEIRLSAKVVDIEGERLVEIEVKDSGYGIAPDQLDKIFDRYFQVESTRNVSGSGIGLALVKSLVTLHQATIDVESELNVGSTFRLRLDMDNKYGTSPRSTLHPVVVEENDDTCPLILVIDDNVTICEYIVESLSDDYRTIVSHNGEEGYNAAMTYMPNLIISDIMMPIMDGIELCHKIKTDLRTSHIPVILLSAKSSQESKASGYDIGADSYITKPFNVKMLLSRIRNLLDSRQRIASLLSSNNPTEAEQQEIESSLPEIDNIFLRNVNEIIEKNIALESLDVKFLSELLFMSHSTLYRKIKGVAGVSINEYIRKSRMKRAAELLLQPEGLSIKEISYQVGLPNTTYFRQCFKSEYGCSPTDYKESNQR